MRVVPNANYVVPIRNHQDWQGIKKVVEKVEDSGKPFSASPDVPDAEHAVMKFAIVEEYCKKFEQACQTAKLIFEKLN